MSLPASEYRIGPSPAHACLSGALHAGAGVALGVSRVEDVVLVPALLALSLLLARDLREQALRCSPRAVVGIEVRAGGWVLRRRDGTRSAPLAVTAARAWCAGLGVVLADARGRRTVLHVPRDALGREALRRLRIEALGAGGAPARGRAARGTPGRARQP